MAISDRSEADGGPALAVNGLSKRFGDRVAFEDSRSRSRPARCSASSGPTARGRRRPCVRSARCSRRAPAAQPSRDWRSMLRTMLGSARRIAIMPESPGLYLRLSVAENLECFAGLYEIDAPAARIEAALRSVNLSDRASDLCGSLSKGLRQRVALARALISDPKILFLDEPTSGLDPVAARDVHELIDGLRQRGVTIFLTTHRLDEAERICDRVAILNRTLRMIGRPAELRERLFTNVADRAHDRAAGGCRLRCSAASLGSRAGRSNGAGLRTWSPYRICAWRRPRSHGRSCRRMPTCCRCERVASLARGRLPRVDRRGRGSEPEARTMSCDADPRDLPQGAARVPAQPARSS